MADGSRAARFRSSVRTAARGVSLAVARTATYERAAEAVDRAVGVVAPRRAVERRHWRRMERDPEYQAAVFAGLRALGYKAASTNNKATPWPSDRTPQSADAELLLSLPVMRNRSRVLRRDDPIGSGILGTRKREIVGTGLRAQSQTGNTAKDDATEEVFAELSGNLCPAEGKSWGALQRLWQGLRDTDGEVLVRRALFDRAGPLRFETIEADRLATPMDALPADPEGQIRDGVERDRSGVVVAYWIAKHHPGDTSLPLVKGRRPAVVALSRKHFDRVPREDCYHHARTDRPGQSRGGPRLHAVMQDIRDLDLLFVAALKRTQVAACLSAFITSADKTPDMWSATAEKYGYVLKQPLIPGMIMKLFPGEKVESLLPKDAPEITSLVMLLAQRIGASVGMGPQSVLRNWADANYSSARTQILDDLPETLIERAELCDLLCWVRAETLAHEQLRGERRLRGITRAEFEMVGFMCEGKGWVDPETEAKAIKIKRELGLTCLRDEAAALGKDWVDLLRQQAREEAKRAEIDRELGVSAGEDAGGPELCAALAQLAKDVASGALPAESAAEIALASFPGLDRDRVEAIVGPAAEAAAAAPTPEPQPQEPPAPPPPAADDEPAEEPATEPEPQEAIAA